MSGRVEENYQSFGARVRSWNRKRRSARRGPPKRPEPFFPILSTCDLFDVEWYLAKNRDVAEAGMDAIHHYLTYGAAELRDPGPKFSTSHLRTYPDVAAAGVNPLVHYLLHGRAEGRAPLPPRQVKAPERVPVKAPERVQVKAPERVEPAPKKKLTIACIAGEKTGGRKYRVERFAQGARDAGYEAWSCHVDEAAQHEPALEQASLILIWRAALRPSVERVLEIAKRHKIPTVFDCDDLMVNPSIVDTDMIDGIRSNKHDPQSVKRLYDNMRRTMHQCNLCITTTEALAAEMRKQGRVTFVLPNGFDDEILKISRAAARAKDARKENTPVRIGYAAGSLTHQKDFQVAVPAIAAILKKYPSAMLVLFRRKDGSGLVELSEFPELDSCRSQISGASSFRLTRCHSKWRASISR